ncbi:hypothetical protein DNHGIG_06490 [Collibacillus ludicampi]|uniref:Uncharacterized protein n=1 Tax=Collibacillus ludicampi TaxID=2771369 RepID=A0AAV4LBC0_9BACL|nr:hypothetical protein DNHGIG_06490 [Collibacillus ludicampi]
MARRFPIVPYLVFIESENQILSPRIDVISSKRVISNSILSFPSLQQIMKDAGNERNQGVFLTAFEAIQKFS